MFDANFAGKTGVLHVRYNPESAIYEARLTIQKEGTKNFVNEDMVSLLKEVIRGGANEKLAMIAFRRFSQGMNLQLRELAIQRRNFVQGTKKLFLAIKAKSKKTKKGKKPFAKKAEKKE